MILGLRRAAISALLGVALFALSFPAIDDLARLLRGLALTTWGLALAFVLSVWLARPRRPATEPAGARGRDPVGEPVPGPAVAEDPPER